MPRHNLFGLLRVGLGAFALGFPGFAAKAQTDAGNGIRGDQPLALQELIRLVLEQNTSVQEKMLDFAVGQRKAQAEHGVFEPVAFASGSHESNLRQNSTEQAAQSNGVSVLSELNNLYEGGVEALLPTGAKIRAGLDISDLNNNIPPSIFGSANPAAQYESFAGLSVTQPLLKNFGTAATMAQIRLAALSSKIAFQEYRRGLMTAVGSAEATYWNLYVAQQQVGFYEDSLKIAERIYRDNQARLDAGQGSSLELMEGQAGVGLRRAKLDDAREKVVEAVNRLISLYGQTASARGQQIVLAESPALDKLTDDPETLRRRARNRSPDYLIQEEKSQQELVRLGYARNQRWFEVNAKAAYGLNGLADSPYRSLDIVTHGGYPSWSLGLELRIPLLGGIKGRNELAAARLQALSAEAALKSIETEVDNGLDTAREKMERARSSATSFQSVVNYNQNLLNAAMVSLSAGKLESRKVFEIESDLFDAKNSVLESLVRYKVAEVEVGLIAGTILEDLHLEITQEQLKKATQQLARVRNWGDASYQAALQRVHQLYPAQVH
jgi:outer membrane protein TolC